MKKATKKTLALMIALCMLLPVVLGGVHSYAENGPGAGDVPAGHTYDVQQDPALGMDHNGDPGSNPDASMSGEGTDGQGQEQGNDQNGYGNEEQGQNQDPSHNGQGDDSGAQNPAGQDQQNNGSVTDQPGGSEYQNTDGYGNDPNSMGDGQNHNATGDGQNHNTTGDGQNHNTTGDGQNHNTTGDGQNHDTAGNGQTQDIQGNGDDGDAHGNGYNGDTQGDAQNHNTTGDSQNQNTAGNGHNTDTQGSSQNQNNGQNQNTTVTNDSQDSENIDNTKKQDEDKQDPDKQDKDSDKKPEAQIPEEIPPLSAEFLSLPRYAVKGETFDAQIRIEGGKGPWTVTVTGRKDGEVTALGSYGAYEAAGSAAGEGTGIAGEAGAAFCAPMTVEQEGTVVLPLTPDGFGEYTLLLTVTDSSSQAALSSEAVQSGHVSQDDQTAQGLPAADTAGQPAQDLAAVDAAVQLPRTDQTVYATAFLPISSGIMEEPYQWTAGWAGMALPEAWGDRVAAIAATQLGYSESKDNFEIDEQNRIHFYTRYGHWAGRPFEDPWSVSFVRFCLAGAGIDPARFPLRENFGEWIEALKYYGVYYTAAEVDFTVPAADDANVPAADDANVPAADDANVPAADDTNEPAADDANTPAADDTNEPAADDAYTPQVGDVVFLHLDPEGLGTPAWQIDAAGIVKAIEEPYIYLIEGDCDGQVQQIVYHITDGRIISYGAVGKAEADRKAAAGGDNGKESGSDEEVAYPAFSQSVTVDGVNISVNAEEGVFPQDAFLSVEKVTRRQQAQVDAAVEQERDEETNVASSYTFDIKILQEVTEAQTPAQEEIPAPEETPAQEGTPAQEEIPAPEETESQAQAATQPQTTTLTELQPPEGAMVQISFSLTEVENTNLETAVYHVAEDEETGELNAVSLQPVSEEGETVTVETDGFSYYTVEFTYGSLEYVLVGDESVLLSEILDALDMKGEVSNAVSSNEDLFYAEETEKGWTVTAKEAFDTPETLTVMLDDIEYVIAVTDSQAVAEYDGKKYATLQEALDAAVNGGEVKLLDDITEAVQIKYDKTNLNLNEHTITIPDMERGINIFRMSTQPAITDVIVQNGSLTGTKTYSAVFCNNASNLVLQNLKIENLFVGNGADGIAIQKSSAVMNNCTLSECNGDGPNSATDLVDVISSTVTMNNCTVTNCWDVGTTVTAEHQYPSGSPSTLTMNNCQITYNTGAYCGGLNTKGKSNSAMTKVTLTNTVITGNTAKNTTYSAGGLVLSRTQFRMSNSAIYGNKSAENADVTNSGTDIYVNGNRTDMIIPAPADMQAGGADLKSYYWYDSINGTTYEGEIKMAPKTLSKPMGLVLLREPINVVRNTRTEKQYTTFAAAVAEAEAGDTIELCAEKNEGGTAVVEETEVSITKNLTIDLNGHHLNGTASSGKLLIIEAGKKLSIVGGRTNDQGALEANEIDGYLENFGDLEIKGALLLKDRILHRGSRLFIEGDHDKLSVSLEKDHYIEADPDLNVKELKIYLLDAQELDALNDRNKDHDDVLVVRNGNQDLKNVVTTPQIHNPHVRHVYKEDGDKGKGIYLVDKIPVGIYIDGVNGDDANDGTEEKPVKTFERAIELLEEMIKKSSGAKEGLNRGSARVFARPKKSMENTDDQKSGGQMPDGIYVMDTIEVQGTETMTMPEGTALIRHEKMTDALIHVTGSLTLQNIVIDGHSEGRIVATSPLIDVDGGTLIIGEGAVIQNNTNDELSTLSTQPKVAGGIVGRNGASIIMNGGTVTGNKAGLGGGIGLYDRASLTMSGGEISGNEALNEYHLGESFAAGGGVFLAGNTSMTLSGGLISGNHSDLYGGGISLGGYTFNTISTDKAGKAVLDMTGGVIDGNTGRGNGGGIYVQANTVANISCGRITNNRALGARNGIFAGGGIYVNSNAKQAFLDYGQLNLSNVLVTENTANITGGGIGACPTSSTLVYVSSGAAIFDNQAETAHDVVIDARHGTETFGTRSDHVAYISHYMLGGGEARWLRDGTELYNGPEMNHELMGHNHLTTYRSLELQADPTQEAKDRAYAAASVVISGNYSGTRGGGIGNNGNIRIGTRWAVNVKKSWDDENDSDSIRPESVTVRLKASVNVDKKTIEIPVTHLTDAEEATLSEKQEWSYTWADLPEVVPDGIDELAPYRLQEITYSVDETDIPEGYTSSVSGNMFSGYTVKNFHEPTIIQIPVHKVWKDEGHEGARPAKIVVRLHDGHTERVLELTEDNDWSGVFTDLPVFRGEERIVYSLTEDHVPNYTDEVEYDASSRTFEVTNTYHPGYREVPVVKDWFDTGYEASRPKSVRVELYADGEATGNILELTEEGRWVGHFKDLPEKKAGKEIVYTVEELEVPEGYTLELSGDMDTGFTLMNTYEKTSISVVKTWDDEGHEAARPEKIIVRLHDGHTEKTLELTAENHWKGAFTDLPVYRGTEKIAYSLTEDHVPNYTDEVSYNAGDEVFTVKNTYHPGYREVSVVKDWFDDGYESKRPKSIEVELYADGEATGQVLKLTEEGRWVAHFNDLPEKKAGKEIVYTVKEVKVPQGYKASIRGNADRGYTLNNTYTPETPTTPAPTTVPATTPGQGRGVPRSGDPNNTVLWILLAAVGVLGAAGACAALVRRKKKGEK